jgi:hypothetical protein
MNNQEKLATQGTQDEENQSKNTIKYVLDTKLFLSSSAKHLLKTGKIPTHIHMYAWSKLCPKFPAVSIIVLLVS